ncbi:BCCT family transporter [Arthrobacter ginkgonis]|uniref:BCCT family transporter n=1 Tax=Arthrobacter ginkgonis TaxID=1630594 RepID=A0ABP7C307_9MICC
MDAQRPVPKSDHTTGAGHPGSPGQPPGDPESAVPYPHDTHPGLVPGISVDEQRIRYGTDRLVFGVAAALIVAFIAWGIVSTDSLKAASDLALGWVVTNTGWLFNILVAVVLAFLAYLAFSRYGRIPLGVDGEKPEYGTLSWITMMFSAGVGIGLFFFGPYEPLNYFIDPAPGMAEPETREAIHKAMAQTLYHWGLHAWALYALVGAAVAYGAYRRGRVPLMSAILTPVFGKERTAGLPGRMIDMFAIIATLFGTAASLGIGTLQIGRGVEIVSGIGTLGNAGLIIIIAVLTIAFIASAVSGIGRGIRWLSNINMSLALVLALFIFIAGPTLFLLNLLPSAVAEYFNDFFAMMGKSASWGPESAEFSQTWTVFYWAWWASWTPFVGIFLARISRGRTLREFIQVTLLVPFAVNVLAFGLLGGTTIWMRMNGAGLSTEQSPQDLLFALLANLPLGEVTPYVAMACIAIFFITSADSASLVMGSLSQRGKPEPDKRVTVFWGLAMTGIAVVMLLVGGNEALTGLQNLVIVSALPFTVILLLMMAAFYKDLRTDPAVIRVEYAQAALENAVKTGIDEHGDRFALAVECAPEGGGAGAEFDSHAEEVTDWYRRTDEDGVPVEYDYASGEYADGWTPHQDGTDRDGTAQNDADQDDDGGTATGGGRVPEPAGSGTRP